VTDNLKALPITVLVRLRVMDNFREALNRAINRLQDGEDFGFTFDGLNIRKELVYNKQRREMLEDKTEDEE
jgi:hypothetical protein